MAERAYIDFEITLRTVGAEYEAHIKCASGEATNTFPLPFNERELNDFFSIFGGRSRRRIESPQLERTRAFGGRLYQAVFNEELDEMLAASLTAAGEAGNGLRIKLDFDEAPDLVNIPWEYLYRPKSDDFFALSNWTPIVRNLDVETRMPPAPIEPPLRILVMISDPLEYRGSLDVEREWQRLEESLADLETQGNVHLHRLERATERDLLRELRRNDYHIFHFVGHGEFDETEQDGVLIMEDENGRAKPVTGRALGTVLRDSRAMRLVVLNNCEGARASDTDPFAGSAQSLIQKGLPAVAAMQFEITDNAAISFAREFYAGLSDGYPADAALAEARKAIYQGATQYEFGSPVLYLSADDGVIFNIADRPSSMPAVDPELFVASAPAAAPQAEAVTETPKVEEPPAAVTHAAFVAADGVSEHSPATTQEISAPPASAASEVAAPEAPTKEMEPVRTDSPSGKGNRKLMYGLAGALGVLVVLIVIGMFVPDDEVAATTVPQAVVTTAAVGATPETAPPAVETDFEPLDAEPPTVADLTPVPLTIDGEEAGWNSRFYYFSDHRVFGAGTLLNENDLRGRWRVSWDSDFLYLFADVVDDVIVQENTGPSLFRGDAVAIYFDGDMSDDAPGAQLNGDDFAFFFGAVEEENWVRLVPTSDGGGFGSDGAITTDDELIVTTDMEFDDGYNVEVRIPWRLLGVNNPQPGQQFRMTLDVSDNDTPGTSQQDAMISNSAGRTAERQAFPEVWEQMFLGS